MDRVQARPVAERIEVLSRFYRERFSLIIEDLHAFSSGSTLVEGVDLLPECVLCHTSVHRAAWMVPTRAFFDRFYHTRPWVTEPPKEDTWAYYSAAADQIRKFVEPENGLIIEQDERKLPSEIASHLAVYWGLG